MPKQGAVDKPKAKSGPKPDILKLKGNWRDAVKRSLQSGWAVGDGIILHTEDGGRSWRMQNSGIYVALYSVAFAKPR